MELTDVYKIEAAFKLPGVKVIDSSFLDTFVGKRKIRTMTELERSIELERSFMDFLSSNIREDVVFPSEFIEERKRLTADIQRTARGHLKHISKQKKRQNGREIQYFNKTRKEEIRLSFDALKNIGRRESEFYTMLGRTNSAEALIYEEGELNLPKIRLAIKEICGRAGILIDFRQRYGNYSVRHLGHKENDGEILAKCLAIAYKKPVLILTRDSDFLRMAEAFYSGIVNLTDRYGIIPVPERYVSVMFSHPSETFIKKPYARKSRLIFDESECAFCEEKETSQSIEDKVCLASTQS